MRRYFNTEGWCSPDRHYMVRLDERLDKIKRLYVDREKYFIINRGRQYGKTTTLKALKKYLADDYTMISMDFQRISSACFADEEMFVISFVEYMEKMLSEQKALQENIPSKGRKNIPGQIILRLEQNLRCSKQTGGHDDR